MIPYCNSNGIGLIPYSPVAAGLLARPVGRTTARTSTKQGDPGTWYTEADVAIIGRVEEVAKRVDMTMAQVALTWVFAKVGNAIAGITSVERLDQNILGDFSFSREDMDYLEQPYVNCVGFSSKNSLAFVDTCLRV